MLSGKTSEDFRDGVPRSDEALFHNASDVLFRVFSDPDKTNKEKLIYILELGLSYYQLDTAVVSSITGNRYVMNTVLSNAHFPFEEGNALNLSDTPAKIYFGKAAFYSGVQDEIETLQYTHESEQISALSYISSVVETVNGPFGSVCFSSDSARRNNFSPLDERLLVQIAGWLGSLLGAIEQLEFSSAQNEHYRTLFASVPAMMFLCDADGLIISASDQFARQIGLDVEDVPGKVCISQFHVDDRESVRQTIVDGQGAGVPAKLVRGEQADLEVELSVSVKPIGTMQNIRMVIAADVSARNAAFQVVSEQNRLLEVANESLNQFAYVASHDLQEPLRKIQLFSSFLEEDLGGSLENESKDHLDVIVNASKRMSTLIEDLLKYSRTSSTDPEMNLVDLNALVKSILLDLELLINDSGATVDISTLPNVEGNEPLLRQLFTNLIGNAIKYRHTDRKPKVEIFSVVEDDQMSLIVTDNGIGFESQFAEKIFEPFKRLHTNEHYQGTGIGLAICATVCEKHGWKISAIGNEDEGSSFVIGHC